MLKPVVLCVIWCLTLCSAVQQNQLNKDGLNSDSGIKQPSDFLPLPPQPQVQKKTTGSTRFFNITSGDDALALFNSSDPLVIELATVTATGVKSFNPKVYYQLTGDVSVTGSRSADSIVSITMQYTESAGTGDFHVKDATIKMDIQTPNGKAFRPDYWRLLTASISLNYQHNGTDQKLDVNLTPKYGYTNQPADLACGLGYSVCAPKNLTWTCTDQTFKLVNHTETTVGSETVILHIPGMKLQPFGLGAEKINFGYSWDCEPLIPLSIWVSVLISLGLAAVVWWALAMLSAIWTPSRFDDPKGPSIHIPQTE